MDIYTTEKGIADYIKMAEGYDGRELIDELRKHLPDGATVLELGMGPGKDLDMLKEHYEATGSDYSRAFLDRYRSNHPDADLLEINAVTLDTDRSFDAIYSNKVCQHLNADELAASVERQAELLTAGGLAIHSFWYGDGVEKFGDMLVYNRNAEMLQKVFGEWFSIIHLARYAEFEDNDSVLIIGRTIQSP